MGDRLDALLAAIAIISGIMRTLYADERAIGFRPIGGRGSFSGRGLGSGDSRRALTLPGRRMGQFLPDGRRSGRTRKRIPAVTPVAAIGGDCARMAVRAPHTRMARVPPA